MKRNRRSIFGIGLFLATFFIAGCANSTRATSQNDAKSSFWQGRLALRVDANPVQSFSAGFELTGNAENGELRLLSPVGSVVVSMHWSPLVAVLQSNGETRTFNTVGELAQQATGADLPIAALFQWLNGDNTAVMGWQASLDDLANGRLMAQRTEPEPRVELRIALDK